MHTLLILRHGKAESYHADGDHERPLTDRGRHDAEAMGKLILEKIGKIDYVISSDAARASETAHIAAKFAEYNGEIKLLAQMYEASVKTLSDIVDVLPEKVKVVLLVGHNPALEEFCAELTGEAPDKCHLPTCGLAQLKLGAPWVYTKIDDWNFVGHWTP